VNKVRIALGVLVLVISVCNWAAPYLPSWEIRLGRALEKQGKWMLEDGLDRFKKDVTA
jgi:hypothetical protein